MAWKVVRTIPGTPLDEKEFRKIGAEYVEIPCATEEEIIAATQDADAILTYLLPYTRRVISNLKKVRLIHNTGTGYDGIDLKAATDYGIIISFPGDYCKQEVAEHTMALILACARKILRSDRLVRQGKWLSNAKTEFRKIWPPMFQLKGQTLGIIGLGRIGQLVVPKAKGFEMKVIAYDPYLPANIFEEVGAQSVDLDRLLSESDFVSVNSALTSENRSLVGLEEFEKMKPTAYFINTARADIADEQALVTALERGYIAGAGLDVVKDEHVPPDHPLLKFDNVIVTAHSAYYSEQSTYEIKRRLYEAVASVLGGGWPEWWLNPEVKEKYLEKWGLKKS